MRVWLFILLSICSVATQVRGQDRFPAPEFRSDYQVPDLQTPLTDWAGWQWIDPAVLLGCLALASYLVIYRRSRRGVLWLGLFALAYFGFWRRGCICAIGAIQNVALAGGGNGYALPMGVAIFFALPLLFALFYGRVFCSSVCPLGAIQDVVLWKPVHVPGWVEHSLGLFAYVYLGLAVMFAAIGSDFVICRYDPFVGFFRFSATAQMLMLGAVLLVASMFVGRVYCRFICPLSVPLRIFSIFSRRRVQISPAECIDCRLCEKSCPFGAMRYPTPPTTRRNRKRWPVVTALVAVPLLMGGFVYLGHLSSGALSRVDSKVRLAERMWKEEAGNVKGTKDETNAFRATGQSIDNLYEQAMSIRHRYAVGASWLGAWIGLVIGWKLVSLTIYRKRSGYDADAGGCVACARCYATCPVEQQRHKEQQQAVMA